MSLQSFQVHYFLMTVRWTCIDLTLFWWFLTANLFQDRFKFKGEENLNSCRNKKLQEASMACDICGNEFNSSQSLKHLKRRNHGEFDCNECGIVFSSAGKLRFHKSKFHLGSTFTCRECGKNFADKSGLKRHGKNIHQLAM